MEEAKENTVQKKLLVVTHNLGLRFGFSNVMRNIIDYVIDHYKWNIDLVRFVDTVKPKCGKPNYRDAFTYDSGCAENIPDRIAKAITEFEPDIVFSLGDLWDIYYLAQHKDKHNFYWMHYMPVEYEYIQTGFAFDGRPIKTADILKSVDMLVAYSKFGQQEIAKLLKTDKITFIHHGYDPTVFYKTEQRPPRREISTYLREESFVVSCIAANGFRKGIDITMDIFSKFLNKLKQEERANCFLYLHTNLYGTGGWNIVELARMYQIVENVIINKDVANYGTFLPDENMRNIYNASDVFISTFRGEGFGLPILEAMACGCRVMYTNYATPPEFADDIPIELAGKEVRCSVQSFSAIPSVKDAVQKLRSLYQQKYKRTQLWNVQREKNAMHAQKYTWDKILPAWVKLFDQGAFLHDKEKRKIRIIKI